MSLEISNPWEELLDHKLKEFRTKGMYRSIRCIENATKPFLQYNGESLLNLSSNNYLGLSNHPLLLKELLHVDELGKTSSRLVIGNDHNTMELEKAIAKHKSTETALLFSNGYMMNTGVLQTILRPNDAVFSDQLNHASIVDGIRLSSANAYRYRHLNLNHLETLLKTATKKGIKRKCIITETIFSMDGDIAPLPELVLLKKKYGALLITDDAHGDGAFGNQGKGMVDHLGLQQEVDLQLGTFSKAFGVYGAYVAGNYKWINYLIQACRSLIYTTALPTVLVNGIKQALILVQKEEIRREELRKKSQFFRQTLVENGFQATGDTHIVPLIIGDENKTISFSEKLSEKKIMAIPIRPPTVPIGSSRIRFTLMSTHPMSAIKNALTEIISVGKEMNVIK